MPVRATRKDSRPVFASWATSVSMPTSNRSRRTPDLRKQVEYGLDLDDIQKARAYEDARRNFAEHGRKAEIGKELGRRPRGHQDDEKLKEETGDVHSRALSKKHEEKRKTATRITCLGGGPTIPAALRDTQVPGPLEILRIAMSEFIPLVSGDVNESGKGKGKVERTDGRWTTAPLGREEPRDEKGRQPMSVARRD